MAASANAHGSRSVSEWDRLARGHAREREMDQRELGTSGLRVSAIGLGCMGMSQSYGPPDDEESVRTLHRALDLGITLIDTADAYGKGANETLIGRAIGGRRHGVVVASKFGLVPGPAGPATDVDARPERVKACCDASLARLRVLQPPIDFDRGPQQFIRRLRPQPPRSAPSSVLI